jgi:hypothetical protein
MVLHGGSIGSSHGLEILNRSSIDGDGDSAQGLPSFFDAVLNAIHEFFEVCLGDDDVLGGGHGIEFWMIFRKVWED